MGVGVANIEANLCFCDYDKRDGLGLQDRIPVDWKADYSEDAFWPEIVEPLEEDVPQTDFPLPAAFRWAAYDQLSRTLTLAITTDVPLPPIWSVRLYSSLAPGVPPLVDSTHQLPMNAHNCITIVLDPSFAGSVITALLVSWEGWDENPPGSATMPVQVESSENLLPPEEFLGLRSDEIIACLLSGRDPIAWLVESERKGEGLRGGNGQIESLRSVDTSSFALYRVRKLGRALGSIGNTITGTVRRYDALRYRLKLDPLGPAKLAESLVREWVQISAGASDGQTDRATDDGFAFLTFAMCEIRLIVAHAGSRIHSERVANEKDHRLLFRETLDAIDRNCAEQAGSACSDLGITDYAARVRAECARLLGEELPDAK